MLFGGTPQSYKDLVNWFTVFNFFVSFLKHYKQFFLYILKYIPPIPSINIQINCNFSVNFKLYEYKMTFSHVIVFALNFVSFDIKIGVLAFEHDHQLVSWFNFSVNFILFFLRPFSKYDTNVFTRISNKQSISNHE